MDLLIPIKEDTLATEQEDEKEDEGGAFTEMLEDKMDSPEEKEIWESRRRRIDNALAAVRKTERQDVAEVYAALRRIGRIEEFISVIESLANQIDPSAIFNWRDTDGSSLLHFAASTNNDILRLLLYYVHDPLLDAQNYYGNTPLHVAINSHNYRAVGVLIRRIRDLPNVEDKNQILGKANRKGNTALHLAVRRGQVNMARRMLEEDLELVYLENVEHKSPLYLALEREDPEMHKYLFSLQLKPSRIQGLPPIHGAILYNRYDLAAQILERNVKLFAMTDSKGGNVFHLAAHMNRPQVFELLVRKTTHLAQQWDMNGDQPIHIACKMGYVGIIEKLFPVSKKRNMQGQSLLHIAAKYGRTSAMRYLLKHPRLGEMDINHRDLAGNTALHLAAMHSQPAALIRLVLDERIDLFLLNFQTSTALDIALDRVRREYTLRKQLAVMVLASTCGKSPAGNKAFSTIDGDKKKPNMEHVKSMIGNRSVVATLVATVTFAAGFAVPGGFNSSDSASKDDQGAAMMLDKRMFQAFAICNTIAMFCSMIAVVTLLWAQQTDVHTAIAAYRRSMLPLKIALPAMSAAFLTGVTLTVGKLPWLANTIFYMGLVFLLIISIAKLLEDPPLIWSRRRPIRIMVSSLVLAYIYLWEVETDLLDESEEDRTTAWISA